MRTTFGAYRPDCRTLGSIVANNQRIIGDMTVGECIYALSGGNIGSATVIARLVKIEPLTIFKLDAQEMYDEKAWTMYKDDCGENIIEMYRRLMK